MYNSYLIALLGLSGAGKSHFVNLISQNSGNNIQRLIAITTRPRRINEKEAVDKFFVSKKQFLTDQENGAYLFDNVVYGDYYAYYKSDFYNGATYICEWYWKRYCDLKQALGQRCICIYIKPSNMSLLVNKIIMRDTDIETALFRIMDDNNDLEGLSEMENRGLFDYVFVNDYTRESDEKFLLLINRIQKKLE